jgi:hypothetical protein
MGLWPGEHQPGTGRCFDIRHFTSARNFQVAKANREGTMAIIRDQRQIVETPTEARQGEPGPSVLALLTASTGLAILILGVVWFAFFRV